MRALPPAVARSGVHVSDPLRNVLGRRTPIDGFTSVSEADSLAGKAGPVRDGSCGPLHKRWAERVGTSFRDGRFPVGLPTGRSSSRGSLRNSTPAHNRFCLKASGSDGVGGLF